MGERGLIGREGLAPTLKTKLRPCMDIVTHLLDVAIFIEYHRLDLGGNVNGKVWVLKTISSLGPQIP